MRVISPVQPCSRSATMARAPALPAPTITIPASAISTEVDEDFAGLDLHRIGPKIDTYGSAPRGSGSIVEAAIVLRTFDDVAHDQTVGEVHLLVCAQAVSRIILIVWRAIDRESAP